MSKDVSITFRTSAEVKEALEGLAEAEERSLSAVIDRILKGALRAQQATPPRSKRPRTD